MSSSADRRRQNQRRSSFIYRFSIVVLTAAAIFGVYHLLIHDYTKGWFEVALALTAALNLLRYSQTRQAPFAIAIIMLGMFAAMPFFVLTGGLDGTGIVWLFVFPPMTYFLTGRSWGSIYTALMFGLLITLGLLQALGVLHTAYSIAFLRQTLAALLAVSIIIYFYEVINEEGERLAEERYSQLSEANRLLQKDAEARAKDAADLKAKTDDLEKLNQLMLGRELKMIELKKELAAAQKGDSDG